MSDSYEYVVTSFINRMDNIIIIIIYCQWYLVSKHSSTHTKRVCYIVTDVGSVREPFCYKPHFLTTSLTLSMSKKFLLFYMEDTYEE